MSRLYFDHMSTTPLSPAVAEAMQPFLKEYFGSPSSIHQEGLRVRDALSHAREQVAAFLKAEHPEEIIFTSSGTEAINMAIKGLFYSPRVQGNHFVVSQIEHPALLNTLEQLEEQGAEITRVGVDSVGRINPAAIEEAIRKDTLLVGVHHANHELGTIQRVREISQVADRHGIPLLVDATASAGWLPTDVHSLGASLLALSPHRFHGPKGVGVLYRHRQVRMTNLLSGSTQENGRRAGMENVPGIVGTGVAAERAAREQPDRAASTSRLQEYLWKELQKRIPQLHLNGPPPGPERLPIQLNISPAGVEGESVLLMADARGLAIASGSNCVGHALKSSHVLSAIDLDSALSQAHVIVSLGCSTTKEEVDQAAEILGEVVSRVREMSPSWASPESMVESPVIPPPSKTHQT